MQTIQIKHRHTDAVLFEYDVDDNDPRPMRTALMAAARAGGEATKLREERDEIAGLKADPDEWDALTEDQQRVKDTLLAAIDRELAAPRPRANLADANLADANLAGANLAGAYLADANLADANLAGAYLAGAYLAGANLADANLADAYLAGANLADAYLARADLAGANLAGAYLAGAYLADARNAPGSVAEHKDPVEPYVRQPTTDATERSAWVVRRLERQAKRAADYRAAHPEVPVVEQLDARILEQVSKPDCALDMSQWHGGEDFDNGTACGTTHCRAGWAVMLAGEAGLALERELGSAEEAGRRIYLASTGSVPHFFASDRGALADIKRCAAEQAVAVPVASDQPTT